jgi:hypothetical protein
MIKLKEILEKKDSIHDRDTGAKPLGNENSEKDRLSSIQKTTGYEKVNEDISSSDINKIKKMIRSEVALILKDLWLKRTTWGG